MAEAKRLIEPKDRACEGKVRFHDVAHARKAAKRQRGRNAYHCRHCGGWHVGNTLVKGLK